MDESVVQLLWGSTVESTRDRKLNRTKRREITSIRWMLFWSSEAFHVAVTLHRKVRQQWSVNRYIFNQLTVVLLGLVKDKQWFSVSEWKQNLTSFYDSVAPQSKSCRSWTQVMCSRSSKWLQWLWKLQFYIVWQRCLLDMPYHKYHLLLVSGLPGPARSWLKFISKSFEEASHLLRRLGSRRVQWQSRANPN